MRTNIISIDTIGKVKKIFDHFVIAEGLDTAYIGEVVNFKNKKSEITGQILNLEKKEVKIAILSGDQSDIEINDVIYRTYKMVEIPVGTRVLGRVMDPVGDCLNTKEFDRHEYVYNDTIYTQKYEIERNSPGIIERETVRTPYMTGINVIDFFIPVGCGQRELVIGDNNTGKTTLCVTVILHQRHWNNQINALWREMESMMKTYVHYSLRPCVYVWVGARKSEAARIKNLLKSSDALNYTATIFTSADQPAALQYLAPYSGAAVAEWFRDNGNNALIIFDDLSQHAVAYRQMSLILRRPPGREAYPGDVFYVHSKLLERSGQVCKPKGGGSVTSFPIIETKAGDISSYIPTNVISITDGQVFLSLELINKGVRPAIHIGLSVSRVGSAAQYRTMNFLSKRLKHDMSLYTAFAGSQKLGSSVDEGIKQYISRGEKIIDLFKQGSYHSYRLFHQVVMAYSLVKGNCDLLETKYLKLFFAIKFNKLISAKYLKANVTQYLIYMDEIEAMFKSRKMELFENDLKNWDKAYRAFFYRDLYPRLLADKKDRFFNMMKSQCL